MKKHAHSSDPWLDSNDETRPQERKRAAQHRSSCGTPKDDRDCVESPNLSEYRTAYDSSGDLEGEGSYSAARRYREGLERSLKKGNVDELAEDAWEALDGPEGDELRRAAKAAQHGRRASLPSHR